LDARVREYAGEEGECTASGPPVAPWERQDATEPAIRTIAWLVLQPKTIAWLLRENEAEFSPIEYTSSPGGLDLK